MEHAGQRGVTFCWPAAAASNQFFCKPRKEPSKEPSKESCYNEHSVV